MTKTPCGRMPLWKWILLFLAGLFVSFLLYGTSSVIYDVVGDRPLATVIAMIACCALMLGVYAVSVRGFEKVWPKDISMKRLLPETGKGLLVGIVYFMLVVLSMTILGCYRISSFNFDLAAQIRPLFMFMMVAVGEEFIFRAVLFRTIDEKFGMWWALGISAILFGLVHISNDNATLWSSVAIALEAGIMLALAYKYSGTLWMPIGIHWSWNYMQGNVLGFAVSGTNAGESIITPSISGPSLITGGEFGAEASVLAIIFGLAISAYMLKAILSRQN